MTSLIRIQRSRVMLVLEMMDNLAETWGDEGVFRRCRDRLRNIVKESQ